MAKYSLKEEIHPSAESVKEQASKLWEVVGSAGMLFNGDPSALTPEQLVASWALLDFISKIADKRKEEHRAYLLGIARENGEVNEKGTYKVVVDGTSILAENRVSALPTDDQLKALLKKANVKAEECYDEVKVFQLNPSKLEYMVERGFLTAEDVNACRKSSTALVVHVSDAVKDVLETVRQGFNELKAKPLSESQKNKK